MKSTATSVEHIGADVGCGVGMELAVAVGLAVSVGLGVGTWLGTGVGLGVSVGVDDGFGLARKEAVVVGAASAWTTIRLLAVIKRVDTPIAVITPTTRRRRARWWLVSMGSSLSRPFPTLPVDVAQPSAQALIAAARSRDYHWHGHRVHEIKAVDRCRFLPLRDRSKCVDASHRFDPRIRGRDSGNSGATVHDIAVVKASIDFAQALTHCADSESFFSIALANLTTLIPADQVFWTRTDFVKGVAEIRGDEGTAGSLGQVLGQFGPAHPAIQTYVADPSNLIPRRISDVTDQVSWHGSPIYREGFATFGAAHQLSLATSVRPPGVGTGWTLTRSGTDFTIREVALASRLLPALIAAEGMVLSKPVNSLDHHLTQRELVVLSLLAEGLTASAIGRRCGITERTVRKHLSSIYEKLDCSDRLMAARLGTELGLVRGAR